MVRNLSERGFGTIPSGGIFSDGGGIVVGPKVDLQLVHEQHYPLGRPYSVQQI
jgi:hypothetical protein